MGMGVLDVRFDGVVPGTVHLEDVGNNTNIDEALSTLKHAHGKNDEEIILEPQPSDDPNDPLNWPLGKKVIIVVTIYMGSLVHSAAAAPLLTSGNVQIAKDLDIPLPKMVQLSIGYYILAAGAICPILATFARKYGKRSVYLLSSVVMFAACLVGATAAGYSSLLAARILQGMGQAAYETIVFNTVGDILFVHQRGPLVALGVFCLNAAVNITGVISGAITTRLGWRYCFWILLPFAVIQMILTIFFVTETSFERANTEEPNFDLKTGTVSSTDSAGLDAADRDELGIAKRDLVKAENKSTLPSGVDPPRRKFWLQELSLYNGTYDAAPLWRIFLAFPTVLLNLGVSFAVVGSGLAGTWFGGTLTISSVILPMPPWNYTTIQVGYASVAPAIGALLAGIFMALASDRTVRALTHWNNGIYEPEFQLPLTFVGGPCYIAGLVSLGYTFGKGDSIYIVCVCWGVTAFGFTCCNATYFSYALSAFPKYSTEILVMAALFRNFLGYGEADFIVSWLATDGSLIVLSVLAATVGGTLVLVAILYVFGKKYRHFWHHHNILKSWHLETEKDERV